MYLLLSCCRLGANSSGFLGLYPTCRPEEPLGALVQRSCLPDLNWDNLPSGWVSLLWCPVESCCLTVNLNVAPLLLSPAF